MILGLRPTIGTVGYLFFARSWLRFITVLAIVIMVTYCLIQRSHQSISLQFSRPVPFPPPVIILPPPTNDYLNPFDACAVEAAARDPKSWDVEVNEETELNGKIRSVYLYLWSSNVHPNDYWALFLSEMDGVKTAFLDIKKALAGGPARSLVSSGGWGGHPDWAIWISAGVSLLWQSGGILMPTGVLMSYPVTLETIAKNMQGLFVANEDVVLPLSLGTHSHHPILEEILKEVISRSYKPYNYLIPNEGFTSPLNYLLLNAVKIACVADDHKFLKNERCANFKVLPESDVINLNVGEMYGVVIDVDKNPRSPDSLVLLVYKGNSTKSLHHYRNLFETNELQKFCPRTYNALFHLTKVPLK